MTATGKQKRFLADDMYMLVGPASWILVGWMLRWPSGKVVGIGDGVIIPQLLEM